MREDDVRSASSPSGLSELAHLLAVIHLAGVKLCEWGDDIDGNILIAHAAQLARGHEWPGDTDIRSTFDFEGSDDPRLRFRRGCGTPTTRNQSAKQPDVAS